MINKHIKLWMICLMFGSVLQTFAQRLSRFEYWFDNQYRQMQSVSVSGEEDDVDLDISTSGLTVGLHWLHIRTKDTDDVYSGITSTPFLKTNPQEGNIVQYWFDNDFENHGTLSLSIPEGTSDITTQFDLRNVNNFPYGFHQLNFRLSSPSGNFGPVYNAYVMKVGGGMSNSIEYWVDGDIANSRIATGTETTDGGFKIIDNIDLSGVAPGFHRLYFRPSSESSHYTGAVSMAPFFKAAPESGNKLEYWFDDDFANRSVAEIATGSGTSEITTLLDLQSLENFPIGYHQLNFRFSSAGGHFGPVASAHVMKIGSGEPSNLEYWIDDDLAHSRIAAGEETSDGGYRIVSDLDFSNVSPGFHRLYYRASSKDKQSTSAISMAPIMVYGGDGQPIVEYWIDDQVADRHAISTSGSKTSFQVSTDLNLSSIAPGFHRLHYRVASTDNRTISSIGMTPIMVKSMYAPDTEDLKVTKYSVKVDDRDTKIYRVVSPQGTITQPHTFDARNLSEGEHTISIAAANSAGIWSSKTVGQFNVQNQAIPTLTLSASENEGNVSLSLNTIPNAITSRIVRVDVSQANSVIYKSTDSPFPAPITVTDFPNDGTYTYYAQTRYADYDGTEHVIRSNDVSISVAKPVMAPEVEYANVSGYIYVNGKPINNPYFMPVGSFEHDHLVSFSDGHTAMSSYYKFSYNDVPVGTKLTATVDLGKYYNSEPVEFIVTKDMKAVVLNAVFDERLYETMQDDNFSHDLQIVSSIKFENQRKFKFTLHNNTDFSWKGNVRVKAIEKDLEDKFAKGKNKPGTLRTYHQVGETGNIEVYNFTDKEIEIELKNLPKFDEDQEFYFIFESQKIRQDTKTYGSAKQIGGTDTAPNPYLAMLEATDTSDEPTDDDVMISVVNLIAFLSADDIRPLVKNLGDFSKTASILAHFFEYNEMRDHSINIKYGDEKLRDGWINFDRKMSYDIWREIKQNQGAMADFLDDYVATIKKLEKTEIKKYLKFIYDTFWEIKDFKSQESEFKQSFWAISKVIDLAAGKMGKSNPIGAAWKTYIEVGEQYINKVLEFQQTRFRKELIMRLVQNRAQSAEQEALKRDYNCQTDFKIMVKKKSLFGNYFTADEVIQQINDVTIHVSNVASRPQPTAILHFRLVPNKEDKNAVMLKQTSEENLSNLIGNGMDTIDPTVFYMEIHWKNGRISTIPLLDSTVKCEIGDYNKPDLFTVKFQSQVSDKKYMAKYIYLTKD